MGGCAMGTEIDGYTTLVKEWIEHYEEVLYWIRVVPSMLCYAVSLLDYPETLRRLGSVKLALLIAETQHRDYVRVITCHGR